MINIDFTLTYYEIYLFSINLFSFVIYAYDKIIALNNSKKLSRVSEKKLLLSTLLGGTVGSLIAMLIFRHKIKKVTFIVKFFIVIAMQIAFVYLYYGRYI